MPIWIVPALAFAMVTSLVLALSGLIQKGRHVSERLEKYFLERDKPLVQTLVPPRIQGPYKAPGVPGRSGLFWSAVRGISKAFETASYAGRLDLELARADIPLKGSEFIAITFLGAVAVAGLAVILRRGRPDLVILAVIVEQMAAWLWLRVARLRRVARFNLQLPDALAVVSNSLRAGYSFLQSMEMVSKEMTPPISTEFSRVLKEMNLGLTTEAALENFSKRVGSDDLDLMITAVLIQRQVGGNLSHILDNISAMIRDRIRIKGEINTLTAQGRISGWIVSLLPIGLGFILSTLNPEYIRILFSHPLGKLMLVGGALSEAFGILIINRIIRIEV